GDSFFGKRDSSISPFCLRGFGRRVEKRRCQRHDFVAERHFVFHIAAVERFGPEDGRGLILSPVISTWASLHAREWHAFTRGYVRYLPCDFAAAVPDLDVFRKSAHRYQVRERTLDSGDQEVLTAG